MRLFDEDRSFPRSLCYGCCDGDSASNGGGGRAAWGYTGDIGPEHWGDLDPSYRMAKTGRRQSPIDLAAPFERGANEIDIAYQPAALEITNNGHSVQVDWPSGSWLTIGATRYELLQFHFHTPSEHTVNGELLDMELHLVHRSAAGELAVVGVFLSVGWPHETIGTLWDRMPEAVGGHVSDGVEVDPATLLPPNRVYVEYDGSLTTPPCTEDVAWIVMLDAIEVSADQVEKFKRVVGIDNRPVQPLNGRVLRAGP